MPHNSSPGSEEWEKYILHREGNVFELKQPLIGTAKCDVDLQRLFFRNKSILSEHVLYGKFQKIGEKLLEVLRSLDYKNIIVDIILQEIRIEIWYGIEEVDIVSNVRFRAVLNDKGNFDIGTILPKTWKEEVSRLLREVVPYAVVGVFVSVVIYFLRKNPEMILNMIKNTDHFNAFDLGLKLCINKCINDIFPSKKVEERK